MILHRSLLKFFLVTGVLAQMSVQVGAQVSAQTPALIDLKDSQTVEIRDSAGLSPSNPDPKLQDLIARVNASELSDEEKQLIAASIAKTEKNLKDKRISLRNGQRYKADFATVSERVKTLTSPAENAIKTEMPPPSSSLLELETKLAALSAERTSIKQAADEAETAISRATSRRSEIDAELPKLAATLETRESRAGAAASSADGSLSKEVMIAELKSFAELAKAQLLAIQNEKALLDAEVAANLPQLTRDRLAGQLESLNGRFEQLRKTVESKRSADAAARVEKADRQIDEFHPALQPIGVENQRLASLDQSLTSKMEESERTLKERTAQLEDLRESLDDAADRVKQVGLTAAVGAMLRNLKQNLPNVSAYRLEIRKRAETIDDRHDSAGAPVVLVFRRTVGIDGR